MSVVTHLIAYTVGTIAGFFMAAFCMVAKDSDNRIKDNK